MTADGAVFSSAAGGRHRRTQLLPSTQLPGALSAAVTGDGQREQPVSYFLALAPGGTLGRVAALPPRHPNALAAVPPEGLPPSPDNPPRSLWVRLTRNYYALLALVLAAQAALSLRLVWSNTAFQDEAHYLSLGHQELADWLHGTPVPASASFLSGAPVVYPPLGALADAVGGLAAARLLSLFFMLGSTVLLFAVTKRIFDMRAALGAAALFAVVGPGQVLGAFATFDAMAVFLLALATWCAVRATGPRSELWLVGTALAISLADAAKYASLLWDPVIIGVVVLAVPGHWLRALMRGLRVALYAGTMMTVALFRFGGATYIHGLLVTTLLRQVGVTHTSADVVFRLSFEWIGLVLLLALCGTVAAFRSESSRIRLLVLVLTAAIVLAPVNQARIHEATSLDKHVVFGAWFAAIVAGYALQRLMEFWRVRNWLVAAVAASAALFGVQQSAAIFHGWPQSARTIAALRPLTSPAACPCLFSEYRVISYYLPQQTAGARLVGDFSFTWKTAGHEVGGLAAYKDAIASHYFGVVELDAAEVGAYYRPLLRAMESAHGYRLMAVSPSNIAGKPVIVWRYTGHGGAARGQKAALTRELQVPHLRFPQVPGSPLGGFLTPPGILRPFLGNAAVSIVGSGLFVSVLMLAIRLCWRRRKAPEEI